MRFELLDAVDVLVKPRREMVKQRVPGDDSPLCGPGCPSGPHTHDGTVTHDALLVQMEAVMRGLMTTNTGSVQSLAFTRGILDSTALYHMTRIAAAVRDWSRKAGAPRRPDTAAQLSAWYVAYMRTEHEPAQEQFHIRELRKWAGVIRDHIEVVEEPVPHACPNPDCTQGFDPVTGRAVWWDSRLLEWCTNPLVLTYRPTDGAEAFQKSTARCRACGKTWSGRELAGDLETVREGATT